MLQYQSLFYYYLYVKTIVFSRNIVYNNNIFWHHPSPHTGQSVDPMPWSSLIERMLLPCLMMVNDPWLQILHSSWPKLIDYDRISHQVWLVVVVVVIWWSWRSHRRVSHHLVLNFPLFPHFHISDDLILFFSSPLFLLSCILKNFQFDVCGSFDELC